MENTMILTLIRIPRRVKEGESSYWIYSVLVDDKRHFKEYLESNGIASDVAHVRNDDYSCFKQFRTPQPGLDKFSNQMINIPVGWWLDPNERDHIVKTLNRYTK